MNDAPAEPTAIRSSRTRGAAVVALLIVAALLMVGAGIGIWAQSQALDHEGLVTYDAKDPDTSLPPI